MCVQFLHSSARTKFDNFFDGQGAKTRKSICIRWTGSRMTSPRIRLNQRVFASGIFLTCCVLLFHEYHKTGRRCANCTRWRRHVCSMISQQEQEKPSSKKALSLQGTLAFDEIITPDASHSLHHILFGSLKKTATFTICSQILSANCSCGTVLNSSTLSPRLFLPTPQALAHRQSAVAMVHAGPNSSPQQCGPNSEALAHERRSVVALVQSGGQTRHLDCLFQKLRHCRMLQSFLWDDFSSFCTTATVFLHGLEDQDIPSDCPRAQGYSHTVPPHVLGGALVVRTAQSTMSSLIGSTISSVRPCPVHELVQTLRVSSVIE